MSQHTELQTLMTRLFDLCKTTFDAKNSEYSHDGNVMDLLNDVSTFEGRNASSFCFSLLMKHITILKFASSFPEKINNITMQHRVVDAINLLVILMYCWSQEVKRDKFE